MLIKCIEYDSELMSPMELITHQPNSNSRGKVQQLCLYFGDSLPLKIPIYANRVL